MNKYELTVIVRTNDVESNQTKVKEILAKNDVNILNEDVWGTKKLAYLIEGEKEGHYNLMTIETSPESVTKITNSFRLDNNILRYMFIQMKSEKSA